MKTQALKTILALALFVGVVQAQPSGLPKEVAAKFYRTCHKLKIEGLPSDKQLNLLAPFLSQDLRRLFQIAKSKQAKYIKGHPGDKPPWIEGDLFSSMFEGSHGYRVGTPIIRDKRAAVPIRLFYREGKDITRWTDTLVMMLTDKGWVVSDLLYKATWEFKTGNSLRGVLKAEVE